jgi:D-tagatose-1,6-bisphosphate aldolase subunit GatZ/KbaZ
MLADPSPWEGYYPGSADEQRFARRYSYSDRMRYYWPDPEVRSAQDRLMVNLTAVELPLPLISQHLPDQYARVRRGELIADPRALVIDHVRDVLRAYARACNPGQREIQPP